jgi:hypothetical protein
LRDFQNGPARIAARISQIATFPRLNIEITIYVRAGKRGRAKFRENRTEFNIASSNFLARRSRHNNRIESGKNDRRSFRRWIAHLGCAIFYWRMRPDLSGCSKSWRLTSNFDLRRYRD